VKVKGRQRGDTFCHVRRARCCGRELKGQRMNVGYCVELKDPRRRRGGELVGYLLVALMAGCSQTHLSVAPEQLTCEIAPAQSTYLPCDAIPVKFVLRNTSTRYVWHNAMEVPSGAGWGVPASFRVVRADGTVVVCESKGWVYSSQYDRPGSCTVLPPGRESITWSDLRLGGYNLSPGEYTVTAIVKIRHVAAETAARPVIGKGHTTITKTSNTIHISVAPPRDSHARGEGKRGRSDV